MLPTMHFSKLTCGRQGKEGEEGKEGVRWQQQIQLVCWPYVNLIVENDHYDGHNDEGPFANVPTAVINQK